MCGYKIEVLHDIRETLCYNSIGTGNSANAYYGEIACHRITLENRLECDIITNSQQNPLSHLCIQGRELGAIGLSGNKSTTSKETDPSLTDKPELLEDGTAQKSSLHCRTKTKAPFPPFYSGRASFCLCSKHAGALSCCCAPCFIVFVSDKG